MVVRGRYTKGKPFIEGTNALTVTSEDSIQDKYDWLKSSGRDGNMGALSATNWRWLILTAGDYGSVTLTLDTDYIGVIELVPDSVTGLTVDTSALGSTGVSPNRLGWLKDYGFRKKVVVGRASQSSLGEGVHLYLTDPLLVSHITDGGDVRVTKSDGSTIVDHKVLSVASTVVILLKMLPGVVTGSDTYYVYADESPNAVYPLYGWGQEAQSPPASATTLSFTTGLAEDPTDQSTHPNVMRVPTGSWMKDDGAAGVVTHIMVDTPMYNANDDYENPSLMYSTDEGVTWAEWPGVTNPIVPFPGGGSGNYNSDPYLVIKSDGSLYVGYRKTLSSTTTTYNYRIVTGTNLTDDVVVAAEATSTIPDSKIPVSPTIYNVSDDLWYLFGGEFEVGDVVSGRQVWRWSSIDEGVTWTDPIVVIYDTDERIAGHWHGGQVIALGDYYYCAWGEVRSALSAIPQHAFRLFRSTDLESWEPCNNMIMETLPTWADDFFYEVCLFLTSDNLVVAMFSAVHDNAGQEERWVGRLELSLAVRATETATVSFGHIHGTAMETPPTIVALFDLMDGSNSGHDDLSSNSNNLSISAGYPTFVPGTGLTFDGDNPDTVASAYKFSTVENFAIEVDLTLGATLPANYMIMCDQDPANPGTRAMILYGTADGTIKIGVWGGGGPTEAHSYSAVGAVSVNTRHRIRIQSAAAGKILIFIDGVETVYTSYGTNPGALIDSGGGLYFGAYAYNLGTGLLPASFTLHRATIFTTVPKEYDGYCPTQVWEPGYSLK